MASPPPRQPRRFIGVPPGDASGAAASCLGWLAFLKNFFDGELSTNEKFALQVLRRLASTPYDRGHPDHEDLLRKLFVLCFPKAKNQTIQEEDERWKYIGFQSADPRRDFRGGGLLALQNIFFFVIHFPDISASLFHKSYVAGFPIAAALINVTHMLTEYLRLSESVGLGAGEPVAPRRAIRCFARLCLLPHEEEQLEACCFHQAAASCGSPGLLWAPNMLPNLQSHSDSELLQSAAAPVRRRNVAGSASGQRRGSVATTAAPSLGDPAASTQSQAGCAVRGACCSSTRKYSSLRSQNITDSRVLNAFGHLFVFSSMRLEQELSRRGAWEPDGADPPPLWSPRHGNHNFMNFLKNNQLHSMQSKRSSFDALSENKSAAKSPSKLAARPEVFPAKSSGYSSLAPPCQTTELARPCRTIEEGVCSWKPEGKEKQRPVHSRAHLCFGDALKEVRNAVDSVLSSGTLESINDMQAICRSC